MDFNIPQEIKSIINKLLNKNFQTYLVGGCVRDIINGVKPKDWDITTDAKPEEILEIFPESIYENQFGTVAVKTEAKDPRLKIIEITTFRLEGKYSDKRHPDEIKFAKTIEEDLARRDFTINAMAMGISKFTLIDPFDGQKDLKNKLIRAVGEPEQRFKEDALRMLRAIRLAAELGFSIEENTLRAIKNNAFLISIISKERVRDEFIKIIETAQAAEAVKILAQTELLKHFMPELCEGIGVGQNKHHIYTIFEHSVRSLDYAAQNNFPFYIRLAALFHDIGKPRSKRGQGLNSTFYSHEIIGARMTSKILERFHFSKEAINKMVHLVRYHLFYYNVGEVTEAGVRRFLTRVGPENIDDLIKVRQSDRIGSGVPKAKPYRIRHLLFMIEKVKKDPISPKMLKVNGDDIMKISKISPGPKVGWILSILLDEVLEEPQKNTKKNLEIRIKNLAKLSDQDLRKIAEKARQKKQEFESGIEEEMKRKYYVK